MKSAHSFSCKSVLAYGTRTFDGLPVVAAVTASRRELVELVLHAPDIDKLIFRPANQEMASVATRNKTPVCIVLFT